MGERLFDVIKSGLMIKRSQNKNRFTLINYKTRWVELTRQSLSYFDIENYEVSESCATGNARDSQTPASVEEMKNSNNLHSYSRTNTC